MEDIQKLGGDFRAISDEVKLAARKYCSFCQAREAKVQVVLALILNTNAGGASIPLVNKKRCHENKRHHRGSQRGQLTSREPKEPFPSL